MLNKKTHMELSARFLWVKVVTAFFALSLASRQGLSVIAGAGHDDRLFLNQALSITQGQWLGDFTQLTLAKGSIFSLFLSINHFIGFPILLSQQILYLFACLTLAYVVEKLCRSKFFATLCFVLTSLNPYFLSWSRVTREPLYTSEAVLIVAASIALVLELLAFNKNTVSEEPENKSLKSLYWKFLLGSSLALFWMTRAEGIWLSPVLFGLFVCLLYQVVRSLVRTRSLKRSLSLFQFCLPIAISFSSIVSIILVMNYFFYGAWLISDMRGEAFRTAYGSLTRVKSDEEHPYIPVPQDVRRQIYAISPTFKQLEYSLENGVPKDWKEPGCRYYSDTCHDIAGGWFVWAFRDAMEHSGNYDNHRKAQAFLQKMSSEVDTACLKQLVECRRNSKTLAPPFQRQHFINFPRRFWDGMITLISVNLVGIQNNSFGASEDIELFETFLHNRSKPTLDIPINQVITISGWFIDNKNANSTALIDKAKLSSYFEKISVNYAESPDLVEYLNNQAFGKHRFSITLENPSDGEVRSCNSENCEFIIRDSSTGKALLSVNVEDSTFPFRYDESGVLIHLKKLMSVEKENSQESWLPRYSSFNIQFTILKKVYSYLGMAFIPLIFLLSFLRLFLFKPFNLSFFVATFLLSSVILRLFILTIIDISSFPGFSIHYLMPCTPLIYTSIVLYLHDLWTTFRGLHRFEQQN